MVSRQRKWQIRQRENGLCVHCKEPAWREGSPTCEKHRRSTNRIAREAQRKRFSWVRAYRCAICREPGHNRSTCTEKP